MNTILHRLFSWAETNPDCIAQAYKDNGKWKTISASEYSNRVYWLGLFYESKGMTHQDIMTVFSYNCPAWVHAELAAVLLGAKSMGLYLNSSQNDIHYILNQTKSKFLAVQNRESFEKLSSNSRIAELLNNLRVILVFDGDTSFSSKAVSYETAIYEGKKLALKRSAKTAQYYINKLDPNSGVFLIFTSGTTGVPKGALLSHDNLIFAVDVGIKRLNSESFGLGRLFSFLPLCHTAELVQNIGIGISLHYSVYFSTCFENVVPELQEVQPHLLGSVPRIWEKMMEEVMNKIDKSSRIKKKLALWALGVNERVARHPNEEKLSKSNLHLQQFIADRLVLSKIRQALGLKNAHTLFTGGAMISNAARMWFKALNLELLDTFGQTEAPSITSGIRGKYIPDTVGKVYTEIEVKIGEDGEILTRGRHVFKGYLDERENKDVLKEGWLHTGDLGEIVTDGFLRFLGRKKEIIKTSGAKIIAPLPIEEALRSYSIINQVCIIGEGKNFVSALITINSEKMSELLKQKTVIEEEVINAAAVLDEVERVVNRVNSTLAHFQQIKKFVVLSREFSIEAGELTPTLKIKRKVVEEKYRHIIDGMYEKAI